MELFNQENKSKERVAVLKRIGDLKCNVGY